MTRRGKSHESAGTEPRRDPAGRTAVLAWTLVTLLVGCQPESTARVRLACATSTQNSGLIDVLVQAFREKTGIQTEVVAVGTGQALALGERGDVDLVLVHSREKEDAFVRSGSGIERRGVMWNDFVIAGPEADPAEVRSAANLRDAMRRIADRGAPFVSRGDDSGTHVREQRLWSRSDRDPKGAPWYASAGQGMGRCLLLAHEKQAYVLTDRGTWLSFQERIDLPIVFEGDPTLRNEYGSILVNPERHPHLQHENARRFHDFLVSPEGQRCIAGFRLHDQVLFHPLHENRDG